MIRSFELHTAPLEWSFTIFNPDVKVWEGIENVFSTNGKVLEYSLDPSRPNTSTDTFRLSIFSGDSIVIRLLA